MAENDSFLKDPPAALIARWEAEAEKAKAEAEAALADARLSNAHALSAEASAAVAHIERSQIEYKRKVELTSNEFHYLYPFMGSVDSGSVNNCVGQLQKWVRLNSDKSRAEKPPIEIVFFSPGGSVTDGLALYDYIRGVRSKGHRVVTGARGMAASMAGILLQAGDHRWAARETSVLIHQVSFGAQGSFGDVKDRVDWIEKQQDRILDIFVERCARAFSNGTATKKVTKAWLKKKWERTDFWLFAPECLELGLIDEVKDEPEWQDQKVETVEAA